MSDRCDFEEEDYCTFSLQFPGAVCSYQVPPKEGEICEKCSASDVDLIEVDE